MYGFKLPLKLLDRYHELCQIVRKDKERINNCRSYDMRKPNGRKSNE